MSRAVMQQALRVLEGLADYRYTEKVKNTMTALRAALAEPEQEPVAWRTFDGEGFYDYRTFEDNENYRNEYIKRNGEKYASWVEPLYTAPTPRKPLTDEEIRGLADKHLFYQPEGYEVSGIFNFARAIERAHGIGGDA